MKNLPFLFLVAAAIFAFAGMGLGIHMAASHDHTLAPVHAHNNLIGWVSLAIYGLYYKVVPAAAATRLAAVHFWISFLGALTFAPTLAMALLAGQEGPVALSALAVIAGMALFVVIVVANRRHLTQA